MRSFFIDPDNISGPTAILSGPEAKHIRQVLRIEIGQLISLFDGTGMIYKAQIVDISKNQVTAAITEKQMAAFKPPHINLAQAAIKKKHMDLIAQKSTELGIYSLYPFISAHCSLNYQPERQIDRWQKIVVEACKQCHRPIPPKVHPMTDLSSLMTNSTEFDHKIILWEKEKINRFEPFAPNNPPANILLLTGPEGGFTDLEVDEAISNGFKPISLGNIVLRAETASLSALSIVKYLLDQITANQISS